MDDQIPEDVKHERIERLIDAVQRVAAARNAERVGGVEEVLVEGTSRTDATLLRGRTRRNTTVNFTGSAAPGELVDVRIDERDLDDAARRAGRAGRRLMRVLVTGSSGQIGTNLALRLQNDGHEVFGVDKRVNAWTDDFRYLLQDLGTGVPRRPRRRRLSAGRRDGASRRAREGAPARARAAPCPRERDHDLQRPRVLPRERPAARLLLDARGLRRRPSLRGVRRGDGGLRLHREPVLGVEDRLGGVDLLIRALLRAALPRLPVLERLRAFRQRPLADGACDPVVHAPVVARQADHGLRRQRQDARLHLHRRLRRRACPRCRGARGGTMSTRRSTWRTARATRSFALRS